MISVVPKVRLAFLFKQAKQVSSLEGEAAEVGVYQGGSAKVLAGALNGRMLHLFDTFEGMPKASKKLDEHKQGDFADTSLEAVKKNLQGCNVRFWPGFFPQSALLLPDNISFTIVHVDVDLYESTKAVLEFFWPRLVDGGIMVFDDYNAPRCLGANKAVDEFFRGLARVEVSGPKRRENYGTRVVKNDEIRKD